MQNKEGGHAVLFSFEDRNTSSKIEVNRHFLSDQGIEHYLFNSFSDNVKLSLNELEVKLVAKYLTRYSLILNDDWWFHNTLRGFIERLHYIKI